MTAQKRRDLQDVDDLGHRRALRGVMHVGQHGESGLALDVVEDRQGLVEAEPASAVGRRAVGLVERAFVDEADAETGRDLGQSIGHEQRVVPALHGARAGDQGERQDIAEPDRSLAPSHDDFGFHVHVGSLTSLVLEIGGPSSNTIATPKASAAGTTMDSALLR